MRVDFPVAAAVLLVVTVGAAAPDAAAQGDADAMQRVERRLHELDQGYRLGIPQGATISERALLDYGGSLGFGMYGIDDAESKSHLLRQTDGRAWVRAELDGAHRFFGRIKLRYDDWNAGEDFDGEGDDLREPIGDRWWYEFDLRGAHQASHGERQPWNVDLRIGKQYFEVGNGLALSGTLHCAVVETEWEGLALTTFAGDTPANDFVDFDASRPHFNTNTKRRFVGVALEKRGGDLTPFAHVFRQIDHNDRDAATFQDALGQTYATRFDYDSTYFGVGARGSLGGDLSWRAELDFETGRALSSPITASGTPGSQTREDLCAWAFAAGSSWLVGDERHSRVDADLVVASGDDDRLDSADTFGGNLSGSDDQAWNAFGNVDTGLALAPDPSNLITLKLGGETSFFAAGDQTWRRLRAVADFFVFSKLESDAPINVPTTADRFVGAEIDVGFDWNLRSDLSLAVRYGIFMPGNAMPAGQDGARQILYVGVTYEF